MNRPLTPLQRIGISAMISELIKITKDRTLYSGGVIKFSFDSNGLNPYVMDIIGNKGTVYRTHLSTYENIQTEYEYTFEWDGNVFRIIDNNPESENQA